MSLCDIHGHTRAISQLDQAHRSGRLAHGYVFAGPEGVGKGAAAGQWAGRMLCDSPVQRDLPAPDADGNVITITDSCGTCTDCLLCQAGNHPDLHFVERTLGRFTEQGKTRKHVDISVEVIRQFVIEPSGSFPAHGRARVFIIDDAHLMNRAAQNALLKTLEEPPANTFVILVTAMPHRLLPTVRSRCGQIDFGPLDAAFVTHALIAAGMDPTQAGWWSSFCQGQLGLALALAAADGQTMAESLIRHVGQLTPHNLPDTAEAVEKLSKTFSDAWSKTHPDDSPSHIARQCHRWLLAMLSDAFSRKIRGNPSAAPRGGLWDEFSVNACSEAIYKIQSARAALDDHTNANLIFQSVLLYLLDCTAMR